MVAYRLALAALMHLATHFLSVQTAHQSILVTRVLRHQRSGSRRLHRLDHSPKAATARLCARLDELGTRDAKARFAVSLTTLVSRGSPLIRPDVRCFACFSVTCGGSGASSGTLLTSGKTADPIRGFVPFTAQGIRTVYVNALEPDQFGRTMIRNT
jgi:hypothetical protein